MEQEIKIVVVCSVLFGIGLALLGGQIYGVLNPSVKQDVIIPIQPVADLAAYNPAPQVITVYENATCNQTNQTVAPVIPDGYELNPDLIPSQDFNRESPNCWDQGDYSECYFEGVGMESTYYEMENYTFSMMPTLEPNSYVLTYPFNKAENVSQLLGKVIVFKSNDTIYANDNISNVVHRCIAIVNNSCETQGDNNLYPDGVIPIQNIEAVGVWSISYLGG